MKKLLSLLAIFVFLIATGCSQTNPTPQEFADVQPDVQPTEEEMAAIVDEIPEDYVGVWQRTGIYVDGILEGQDPAIWNLNATNYTSTGSCINTGKVMYEGDNKITVTLDSTTCPGVTAGGSTTYSYEISYDDERQVETMTVYTGPVMETYDRQS